VSHYSRIIIGIAAGALLSAGCGMLAGPDQGTDAVTVFDAAWHEIDAHYSFFSYKHLDWDAEHARYRPQVQADSTALRSVLCAMVNDLRSYHAGLYTSPTTICGYAGPRYPANFLRPLAESNVPGGIVPMAGGRFRVGHPSADIGYVGIPSFDGNWGDQFDDVIDALGPVRALVIDIRGNPGGNDGNGLAIAGRLTDRTVVYQHARYRNGPGRNDFTADLDKTLAPRGRRHFSGPVALLTNRANGSAAEDFLTMMRVIPTVFTVGDTTIGNSSNPLLRELPNGWQLRVPQSIQMTPDGYIIEDRGLPPDFPVMLAPADSARGVDTILQRAIAELRRRF
jgi:hypothetical protein